jgi:hypothetical protein
VVIGSSFSPICIRHGDLEDRQLLIREDKTSLITYLIHIGQQRTNKWIQWLHYVSGVYEKDRESRDPLKKDQMFVGNMSMTATEKSFEDVVGSF